MIEKPSILVTSLGRTGTEFFSHLFQDIIVDCTSLHEPNTIPLGRGELHKFKKLMQRVQQAGVWRMVVLKAIGQWTLANLSDHRLEGRMSREQAIRSLERQRCDFVEGLPTSVYAEANFGYYGLLDITPHVFQNHKMIYVIRDGRDWVTSGMNWREAYGKPGFRRLVSHNWPTARDITSDPWAAEWDRFSEFEKYCWAWAALNQYALSCMKENLNARLFYFEKIYQGGDRYKYLDEIIRFVSDLPGVRLSKNPQAGGWLEKKIHASVKAFPRWDSWTAEQRNRFDQICGPLMKQLGYDY